MRAWLLALLLVSSPAFAAPDCYRAKSSKEYDALMARLERYPQGIWVVNRVVHCVDKPGAYKKAAKAPVKKKKKAVKKKAPAKAKKKPVAKKAAKPAPKNCYRAKSKEEYDRLADVLAAAGKLWVKKVTYTCLSGAGPTVYGRHH